jgi:hypothetical protein
MNAHTTPSNADDVKRDIQATLEARRELGPAYDEQFLDALVEKLTRQVAQARQPQPLAHNSFNAKQRSELAIVSLVFAVPLIAIAGAMTNLPGVIFVCAAIVAINFMAAKL